jgi:hypothetical protein
MQTTIIQTWGGPGIGKTTLTALTYAHMKMSGKFKGIEMVGEYAKQLVVQGKSDLLQNQPLVTSGQQKLYQPFVGHVPFIITDSPLSLGLVYASEKYTDEIGATVDEFEKKVNLINILIKRNQNFDFEQFGRAHTLEQSLELDNQIECFVNSRYGGKVLHYEQGQTIDGLILSVYQEIHKPIRKIGIDQDVKQSLSHDFQIKIGAK